MRAYVIAAVAGAMVLLFADVAARHLRNYLAGVR